MKRLSKLTNRYVESQDRISLTGQVEGGDVLQMWLTQRLLNRLLPVLLKWLDDAAPLRSLDPVHAEVLQGFAQQAARAHMAPQTPVEAAAQSESWLVVKVDIGHKQESVVLTFRGSEAAPDDDREARLEMSAQSLRQWLGVLHSLCAKAQWPLAVWPQWLQESATPAAPRSTPLH